MIKGIGIDLIEIPRLEELIERQSSFITRILTPIEVERCNELHGQRKLEFVSGRFAAKEALSKALGTGISGSFTWHSVSILSKDDGAPEVIWHHEDVPYNTHLSITHTLQYAMAYVVLEEKN